MHFTANTHDLLTAYSEAALTKDLQFLTDGADYFRTGWWWEKCFGAEDVIFADLGDDRVFTGRGDDVAFGGGGNDWLFGGPDDDILAGGSGNDRQFGGRDSDVLSGQDGDDLLVGGAGADFLFDGLGDDVCKGGIGRDLFLHVSEDVIGGAPGSDDADLFVGGVGRDTLLLVVGDETARTAAIDAVEAGRGPGKRIGDFSIAELGVEAKGFERVVIFDRLVLPNDATTDRDLAEAIADADLWSVLPPADGGTGLADAIYVSEHGIA